MPQLDRVFRVSVVNGFWWPLKGALIRIYRDGKLKAEGSIEGKEPYIVQLTGPGKVEVEAIYKRLRKKQEVLIGESSVKIRLTHWATLPRIAAAAAILIAAVIWLLNRGVITVGTPSVKASYVGEGSHHKPVAVVFVHGIFGDETTWASQETSFPQLLTSDPAFADKVDAFVFRYYSPRFGPAGNVAELAKQLKAALEDNHVLQDHEHVVFLCHSMGGLVTRRALILMRDLKKVSMIYFYATPGNGAEIAQLAGRISSSPQLKSMLPLEGNEALQQIQDDWMNWPEARTLPSYCSYETLATDGVIVVNQASARSLCNRLPEAMTANHSQIVKPEDRTDPRYTRFATALQETALNPLQPGH